MPEFTLTALDVSAVVVSAVVVYALVIFGIGLYFSRKTEDGEDYFLAGRCRPGGSSASASSRATSPFRP